MMPVMYARAANDIAGCVYVHTTVYVYVHASARVHKSNRPPKLTRCSQDHAALTRDPGFVKLAIAYPDWRRRLKTSPSKHPQRFFHSFVTTRSAPVVEYKWELEFPGRFWCHQLVGHCEDA